MSSGNKEKETHQNGFLKKLIDFLIFSNIFITACALLMVVQTYQVILEVSPDTHYLFFVLFSTLCSYSFHWWLTVSSVLPSSRLKWLDRNRAIHLVLFFIGLIGSAIYFFKLLEHWHWLLLTAFITFLYSAPKIPHPWFRALRKVALGKTIFLAFVWMNVTTLLPILISGQDWKMSFSLFLLHRFFLIYAICILFDYRDREDDIAAGIKSLITFLNKQGILVLFIFSLLVFAVSTISLYWHGYSIPLIAILLLPGFLTAFLYKKAMNNFSDIFYYFILDGLMAFSSLLTLIAGNWLNLRT